MATSFKSYDTDIITLRQIYTRTPYNAYIPDKYVLISDGVGVAYWGSVSSITTPPYDRVTDTNGSTITAGATGAALNLSTVGLLGLTTLYADTATSTFTLSNAAPNLLVALDSVPTVSRLAAATVPSPENITMSTSQSTLKFIGVGDIKLSTVTDLRSVFFSISSFTATGYADLSGEARAWRPYVYSTNSTSAGYATFTSSIPFSTMAAVGSNAVAWDWTTALGAGLPLSTVEAYPNYTTGDIFFSSISFRADPFLRYVHPNSTTRMFLDVRPNYFFPRMFQGTSSPYTLVKEFSSFVQYQSARTGPQIMPSASIGGWMTSQRSNVYASNYFEAPLKLELDAATMMSNYLMDGAAGGGTYTLYHRIPGAMAELVDDGYCGYNLGVRGGFSNPTMIYDNRTPYANAVFLEVYNQQGAAPPMPGP
jgi:hypothetical protein